MAKTYDEYLAEGRLWYKTERAAQDYATAMTRPQGDATPRHGVRCVGMMARLAPDVATGETYLECPYLRPDGRECGRRFAESDREGDVCICPRHGTSKAPTREELEATLRRAL